MKPVNEMDYLYASGRIRALEGYLLNRERANHMIDARTPEEAFRILADCGYGSPPVNKLEDLEQLLDNERIRLFHMISGIIPDGRIVDFFRIRYDIHNMKVLLKSSASSQETPYLLLDCGRIRTELLASVIREMALKELPPLLALAVEEARDILARTGDSQLMDIALDKACLNEMLSMAKACGSTFLTGYARLIIDSANLRTLVRVKRMGKGTALLHHGLAPGGNITVKQLVLESSSTALDNLYVNSPLKDAGKAAAAALKENGTTTELDIRCDNGLMSYLRTARTLAFGSPLVVAYLAAKESEITSLRTILSGRMAGISQDSIKERIRDHYV